MSESAKKGSRQKVGVDFSAGLQHGFCALKYPSPEAHPRFEMSCVRTLALKRLLHASWLLRSSLPPSTSGQRVTSQCPDNSLFSNAL